MKRWPLITSFVLFITLCVSAAYWGMQLFKPPMRAIAAPPQASQPAPRLDAAASLLGGSSSFAVASNFQLKGVVVASNPAESVAILAANGKPAQAIRAHHEVMPGVTVSEVQRDHVLLSENGVIKRVDLPVKMRVGISPNAAGAGSPPVNYPGLSEASQPYRNNREHLKSKPAPQRQTK